MKNGNISGALDDGQAIKGSISKDGTIEAYATSSQAFGEMNGKVTDWKSGKGSGTVTVGGGADCEGTWTMKRK
ncbi:MAG: hypothetical protein VB913_11720 [Rhodospirillales bacterium]